MRKHARSKCEICPYFMRASALCYKTLAYLLKAPQSCFLNRNSKDFSQPGIIKRLKTLNCKFFADFEKAYKFINSQIK